MHGVPASQLRGEEASGFPRRLMMARQTELMLHAGVHAVFNISRHISPVCKKGQCLLYANKREAGGRLTLKWKLGWNIGVLVFIVGGEWGYDSGTLISRWKVPPAKGVSSGPVMMAVHLRRGKDVTHENVGFGWLSVGTW